LISSETTFPIAAASMTSDVAPNAPTAGEEVAPISTSSIVMYNLGVGPCFAYVSASVRAPK
jgi:hypothetical protein